MSTITVDQATYNEAEAFARLHNISVSDAIKTGLELLFKQFKSKTHTANNTAIPNAKKAVINDIEALKDLESNWDGYGAMPILTTSIDNAKEIVLNKIISADNIEDIQPNPNGTVTITWSKKNNQVCLEVGTEMMSYFADIDGKVSYSQTEKVTNENTLKLAAYVNQL